MLRRQKIGCNAPVHKTANIGLVHLKLSGIRGCPRGGGEFGFVGDVGGDGGGFVGPVGVGFCLVVLAAEDVDVAGEAFSCLCVKKNALAHTSHISKQLLCPVGLFFQMRSGDNVGDCFVVYQALSSQLRRSVMRETGTLL